MKRSPPPPPTDLREQILRDWVASAEAFASCFLIPDKNTKVVDFDVSPPQRQALALLERARKSVILKGRQMWITTIVLIWQLRLCWMQPGSLCAVVMHTDANAQLMARRALDLWRGNPLLIEQMPEEGSSAHYIRFLNGSQMVFTTANSEFLRSLNVNFAHLSEPRDYDDLGATLASLKIAPNGQLCIEGTAGGEDDFYSIWQDSDPSLPTKGDFRRQFLCWRDHPEYRNPVPFAGKLLDVERDYIAKNALSQEESSWWVRERRGLAAHKRHLMVQENPSTAEEAFLLSGDKYLRRKVPTPAIDAPDPDGNGVTVLLPYDPTHEYAAGIDPAPGSSDVGDPTGIVIIDKTANAVALTQELREPTREHESKTLALLKSYGNPLTVVETNSEGLGLCDYLRGAGVPMYHMVAYGGLNPEMLPRHGWRTDTQTRPILFGSIYQAAIGDSQIVVNCRRLTTQLNALCYDKKGKPAAPRNGNDDLAVAYGLAVLGMEQTLPPEQKPEAKSSALSALEELERAIDMATRVGGIDDFSSRDLEQPGDFY